MTTTTTAEQMFKALTRSLADVDDRKILQTRFKGIAIFDLQGEGDNSNNNNWCLDTTKGTLERENVVNSDSTNNNNNDTVRVTTTIPVLQDLLSQKLSPQQAFVQGKLKIKGNMGLAMKLNVVLQAIRKHLQETPITSRL